MDKDIVNDNFPPVKPVNKKKEENTNFPSVDSSSSRDLYDLVEENDIKNYEWVTLNRSNEDENKGFLEIEEFENYCHSLDNIELFRTNNIDNVRALSEQLEFSSNITDSESSNFNVSDRVLNEENQPLVVTNIQDLSGNLDSSISTNDLNQSQESSIHIQYKYFSKDFHTVIYSNIDQNIANKLSELIALVELHKPSIVCLTEIEPKIKTKTSNIKESEIQIPNYSLFLNSKRKRGVAMYIHQSLDPRECYDLNKKSDFEEYLFCEVSGSNNEKMLLGVFYRSPNSSTENNDNLLSLINIDHNKNYDVVCIMGDFNFSNIRWDGKYTNQKDQDFIEASRDALLNQKVKHPTRNARLNQRANILDLIFINDDELVNDIIHEAPIGKSDHDTLIFQLNIPKEKIVKEKVYRYNLSKGNYEDMRKYFDSISWENLEVLKVEECWNEIKSKILEGMEKFIPKIETKTCKKLSPCWMNNKLLKKIKKKYYAFKRYLITKDGKDYETYIRKRNQTAREIRRAKRKHEKNISQKCKEDPNVFWKYVNAKSKTSAGLSCLKDKDGNLLTSDKDKANALNNFFTSVFSKENLSNLPNLGEGSMSGGVIVNDCIITEAEIVKKLKDLNHNKAQGPDLIPPKVLKELASQLSKPLYTLFNKSLEDSEIPSDWKFALVTALHKKGNKTDPSNYRPVSLTCICCKIMEKFIKDSIINHINENNLYSECQHGFRSGRSCVTQLIEVIEDLTKLIDQGKEVDIIYLDFKKAFDSIPHERLLLKMRGYGISGKLLGWVRAFLLGRKQQVRVGTSLSEVTEVLSGIPQGSILGPVLFTIFINDLPNLLQSTCKIFADDTKIYNDVNNSDVIQSDLYKMQEWTEVWNLYFNVSKCKVMHLGKKNDCKDYVMKIESCNQKLETCDEEKDLGITFDNSLNFDIHIDNIIKKANQMIGVIKRTFTYLDKEIFVRLYKSLVRSNLEYGNIIWSPYLKRQSISIEKVQRRATKLVPQCKNMSYKQRLEYLNLYSLKGRRERGDLIQTYKILHDIDNVDKNLLPKSHYNSTRNQSFKLRVCYSRTDKRKYTYSNRIVLKWNELPEHYKNAQSLNSFKNLIDKDEKYKQLFMEFDGRE